MLAKLFGRGRPVVDPRAMLVEALTEIAGEGVGRKAAECFDHPERFVEVCDESGTEPPWDMEGREPKPGERAQGIFQQLLEDAGHAGIIDWADGGSGILDVIQELLQKSGAAPFRQDERDGFLALAGNAKRGDAFAKLDAPLRKAVQERGLVLSYLERDGDSYHPVIVSPQAYAKWSKHRFDADHGIL